MFAFAIIMGKRRGFAKDFWLNPRYSYLLLVIESKQPHQKNFSRIAQRIRKRSRKTLSHFATLCCGILTIDPSHSFLRRVCFTGQNGAFSTTEQNGIKFSCFFPIILLAIRPQIFYSGVCYQLDKFEFISFIIVIGRKFMLY